MSQMLNTVLIFAGSQNAAGQAKNQYKREKRRESQGDRNGQSIQNQGQQPEPGHKVQNRVQGHRHHGGIQSQVSSSARSTCSQGYVDEYFGKSWFLS